MGPAGSGKSLVAVEKARRLAREGFRTLFVCFNQPLATEILREFERDGVSEARLLLFSRSGFALEVHEAARLRPDLELVDLERIYAGT